jgi:hypothetical protein
MKSGCIVSLPLALYILAGFRLLPFPTRKLALSINAVHSIQATKICIQQVTCLDFITVFFSVILIKR